MIEVGKKAPAFTLPDETGEKVSLKDLQGDWVVLYFYPRDDTPGCTTEACEFTANLRSFEKLGARVLGVSPDSPQSHARFIEKHQLGIRLLSDADHAVMEKYGAWGLKKNYGKEYEGVIRSTVLIDPEGREGQGPRREGEERARGAAGMSVRVERRGPVTTVVLDRPKVRNAVDRATAGELADAFRAFDADETARVAVLFGDHGTFSAGADLKAIAAGEPNRVSPEGDGPMGPTRLVLGKPVIAAISGHAVAGGLELALWCDLRVAEENAVLGVFCRRFGVPLLDGGTVRLPRIVGLGRALDLLLTGRAVSAGEALAMGLVNRVVPAGQARAAAESLAAEIAAFPQVCMRGDRLSAYEQAALSLEEALQNELRHGMRALEAEALAGARRFTGGAGRGGAME
jgi:enoyl-CoA hydratase